MKLKNKLLLGGLTAVLLAVMSFSAWKIWVIRSEYHTGESAYEDISHMILLPQKTAEPQPPVINKPAGAETLPDEDDAIWPEVDFAVLREINPDIVAWIYIEGTKINYPIVQGRDNSYYLKHLFSGEWNGSGCIFLDFRNDASFADRHSIIYGHHMGCKKWPAFRSFAEEAVAGSAKVLAVSADNRNLALEQLPMAADKLLLLPNGYNEDIFYREDVDKEALFSSLGLPYCGEYIVLFVGKLAAFKGVDTLLRAARRYEWLADREFITLIVGDGEERESLSELHKQLGLRNTFFLGNQKQDELRRLYNAADVFVMPSRREPFGLVALEAMACGLPVVGSNEGGLPEFINSQVGTLVSPEDEESFCAAILNELTRHHVEPERRDVIAGYARSNFAQAQFVAKLEQVYQRAVRDFSG